MPRHQTDPSVIELTEEERRLLADRHPSLAREGGWLIPAAAVDERRDVQALLGALADLGQASGTSLRDVQIVLRVGGRDIALKLGVGQGDEMMLGELPASAIAHELDLANRLHADPRSLARLRRASDAAWERLTDRWGVFSDYQVAQRAGYEGERPAAFVTPFVRQRRLFGVRRRGRRMFPGFQFDKDMQPRPHVRDVLIHLPSRWANLDRALWFDAPNGWLNNRRPAELLVDAPNEVVKAAEYAAVPPA